MSRLPQPHFRLKPKDSSGESLIYLQFIYQGNRLFYSWEQKIKPALWDMKKQAPKQVKEVLYSANYTGLDKLLQDIKEETIRLYKESKGKKLLKPDEMRDKLNELVYGKEETEIEADGFYKLIERFKKGEIQNRGNDKSENTLQTYHAVEQHLLGYERYESKKQKRPVKLTFDSITLDFFYSYVAFLKTLKNQKGEPLSQNTIAKDIRVLKVFLGEAVDLKLTKNVEYLNKKFSIAEVETDAVYLSDSDINKLYSFDFSAKKKLEQVRDLFVFGCYVGLRFSDYSTIKKGNIVDIDGELFIKVITEKTKELVIIPCNPVVLEIFKKYESNPNSLPKSVSNQKFNDYIKQACEKAGLTSTGRLSTNPDLPLFQCVSSHTCRRSFATNLYLEGYPVIEIMKITGHKTEKAFMKYIRVTKLDAAKRLSQYLKMRWDEKRIKAGQTLTLVA